MSFCNSVSYESLLSGAENDRAYCSRWTRAPGVLFVTRNQPFGVPNVRGRLRGCWMNFASVSNEREIPLGIKPRVTTAEGRRRKRTPKYITNNLFAPGELPKTAWRWQVSSESSSITDLRLPGMEKCYRPFACSRTLQSLKKRDAGVNPKENNIDTCLITLSEIPNPYGARHGLMK